ncbi:MAG: CDP-alcohol phosphatidyltransferase family protein [Wenzhouxiangella sp.]
MKTSSQAITTGPAQGFAAWSIALAAVGCGVAVLAGLASLPASAAGAGAVLLLGVLLWRFPPPGPALGWANAVTLVRALLMAALCVWLVDWPGSQTALWAMTLLALAILTLDGVDGFLARRFDECSDWGARFDMEVDAAFILLLCLALWLHALAPAWVLLIGLMRYAFLAAGFYLPWMARDLPERFRRKLVCVIQLAVLIVAVSPVGLAADGWREGLLAFALLALSLSFGADVRWLYRNRPGSLPISRHSEKMI